MAEEDLEGEVTSSRYDDIVGKILSYDRSPEALVNDQDAIVARLVVKLKQTTGWKEGDSEQPLYSQAREMYWAWMDSERKKDSNDPGSVLC